MHPNFDFKNTETNEEVFTVINKVIQKYFPGLKTLKKFLIVAKEEL
jgi:hypothetical protein